MAVEIKSETIDFEGTRTILVSVKNGESVIGVCSAGYNGLGGIGAINKIFFIGNDPAVNIVCPSNANKKFDKMLAMCPGFVGYNQKIGTVIGNCYNKLNSGDDLVTGLKDMLGMLQDGVYALYVSDYYPTDGNNTFFWGAYNILHDVHGTAEHGRVVGNHVYKPCFLIPSMPLDYYQPKMKASADELVKIRRINGIVYHLTGFHSVLLKGHHEAVSCLDNDVPFRCAVIEKIGEPYVNNEIRPHTNAPAAAAVDPQDSEAAVAEETAPVIPAPVTASEGITGFRCSSLKLPLEVFPKDMLKTLLEGREEYKPRQFEMLIAKLNTVKKKSVSNNVLPISILEKSDAQPDCDMVESAFAVDGLSDEQLGHLLAGDVDCNGEVIISPNFYSSIVTACNFLQFTDMKRFVDFSIAILDNPELSATHEYVAHRALSHISNKKLTNFFAGVLKSKDAKYEKFMDVAQKFMERSKNG